MIKTCTGNNGVPPAFLKDVIIATTKRVEMEPDGLKKVPATVMESPDVQRLRNQADRSGPYMEP